jgi:hypothetical protein
MSEEMKNTILSFLQKRKLELIRQIPGFIEASLKEDDGEYSLLIEMDYPIEEEIDISFDGVKIPVETTFRLDKIIKEEVEKKTQSAVVMRSEGEEVPRPENVDVDSESEAVGVVSTSSEVSVGPHQSGAKSSKSFEAWKRRHKSVRIK